MDIALLPFFINTQRRKTTTTPSDNIFFVGTDYLTILATNRWWEGRFVPINTTTMDFTKGNRALVTGAHNQTSFGSSIDDFFEGRGSRRAISIQ